MAIDALSIFNQDGSGMSQLKVKYGPVIENIQNNILSATLKNQELSGDPQAGTVKAHKLVNATVNQYGTARSGQAGTKLKAADVDVNLDQHIEIIEEVEEADLRMYGVDGLINRRVLNHQARLAKTLDRAFFAEAVNAGTPLTTSETQANKKADALIVAVETTKNDFVDGVDRSLMTLVLSPAAYTELQDHIDTLPNVLTGQTYQVFHNVKVASTTDLPTGVEMLCMVDGTVAQPAIFTLDVPGKIPMSNAYHFGIFCDYGTKSTNPELCQYIGNSGN